MHTTRLGTDRAAPGANASAAASEGQAYRSRWHPEGASWALVYGQALVRPLGACMLPVMIAATTVALQAGVVLPFLTYGFPAALALAMAWAHQRLAARVAVVRVRGAHVALASVTDVLTDAPPTWRPLLDLRANPQALLVTAGYATTTLDRAAWPDADALQDALEAARRRARSQFAVVVPG